MKICVGMDAARATHWAVAGRISTRLPGLTPRPSVRTWAGRLVQSVSSLQVRRRPLPMSTLAAMQEEGTRVRDEGIARTAADIDVAMVTAFGFPRWKGGPMFAQGRRARRPSQATPARRQSWI